MAQAPSLEEAEALLPKPKPRHTAAQAHLDSADAGRRAVDREPVVVIDGSFIPVSASGASAGAASSERRSDIRAIDQPNPQGRYEEAGAYRNGTAQAEARPLKHSASATPGPAPSDSYQPLILRGAAQPGPYQHAQPGPYQHAQPGPYQHASPYNPRGGASGPVPGPAPERKPKPVFGPVPDHQRQLLAEAQAQRMPPPNQPQPQVPWPRPQPQPQPYTQNQFPRVVYQPYEPLAPLSQAGLGGLGAQSTTQQPRQQTTEEKKPLKTSKTFDTKTLDDNQYFISICLCITLTALCNPFALICCIPAFYFASKSAKETKQDKHEPALDHHRKAQYLNVGGFIYLVASGLVFFIMLLIITVVGTVIGAALTSSSNSSSSNSS